ncbi:SGNH/GDSL hydrolase family protein [Streptomyces sp. NPDC012769]|uniref:SGNH/GDSL hydrolase family protein n=1 Tax=Streptomyces sp. NPDC012769 TaxID=3364848 RepID=UPI0036C20600
MTAPAPAARRAPRRTAAALLTAALVAASTSCTGPAPARTGPAPTRTATAPTRTDDGAWRGAWAASPQPPSAGNWSERGFADHTLRQVVRLTAGGTEVRIELSNRYGTTPLRIAGATVARPAEGAAVRPGSVRTLTFGKRPSATIPVGGTLLSDGLPLTVRPFESLTVTLRPAGPTGPATVHRMASATGYRAAGDHRGDVSGGAFTETGTSWYYLTGVEVTGGPDAHRRDGVVAFGDSLTDGHGSTLDADRRYPDRLAERLAALGRPRPVLNHGISGNKVVRHGGGAGEKALDRFAPDALDERGVGTVLVLEGINDIGGRLRPDVTVDELIAGHRELVRQAHARGLKAVGATLVPFKGSVHHTPENEAQRDAFNTWMRTSGTYDAVIDLDRALADPADPDRLLPAYDSGDHLHPSDAGYRAMAEAVDPDAL